MYLKTQLDVMFDVSSDALATVLAGSPVPPVPVTQDPDTAAAVTESAAPGSAVPPTQDAAVEADAAVPAAASPTTEAGDAVGEGPEACGEVVEASAPVAVGPFVGTQFMRMGPLEPMTEEIRARILAAAEDPSDPSLRAAGRVLRDVLEGDGALAWNARMPLVATFGVTAGLGSWDYTVRNEPCWALFRDAAPRLPREVPLNERQRRTKAAVDNLMRAEIYAADCREAGVGPPTRPDGSLAYDEIERRMGGKKGSVFGSTPVRTLMVALAEELGGGPVVGKPSRADGDAMVKLLVSYGESKVVVGEPFQASPTHSAHIDHKALETLVPGFRLALISKGRIWKTLRPFVLKVGMHSPGADVVTRRTFGALIAVGTDRCRRLKGHLAKSEQTLKNKLSAMSKFMDHFALAAVDDPAEWFGVGLEGHLASMGASANVASLLRCGWKEDLGVLCGQIAKGDRMGVVLARLSRDADIDLDQMAEAARLPAKKIGAWMRGYIQVGLVDFEAVARLEVLFGTETGYLTGLIRHHRRRHGKALNNIGDYSWRIARFFAPNAVYATNEELAAEAERISRDVVRQPSSFGATMRKSVSLPGRGAKLPADAPYNVEAEEIRRFKCAPIQVGEARSKRGKWASTTAELVLGNIRRVIADCQGTSVTGGLGVAPRNLSAVLLLNALIPLNSVLGRSKRFEGVMTPKGRRAAIITPMDHVLLINCAALFRAKVGYIRQHPELAELLVPNAALLPHLLDDERLGGTVLKPEERQVMPASLVALARSDWDAACDQTETRYRQFASDIYLLMKSGRDSFEPIQVMIDAHSPVGCFMRLVYEAADRIPDVRTQPVSHHVSVRNIVIMRLIALLFLRSKNLRNMTYLEDGTGQLRHVDGFWEVHIPYEHFKNSASAELFGPVSSRMDYKRRLPDVGGLYDLLQRYVSVSLPFLRARFPGSPYLFPTSVSPCCNSTNMSSLFREWTRQHCVYDPGRNTGMPGVMSFGPHAVRDLGATTILKDRTNQNALQEAADLLQTSKKMVLERYAKLNILERFGAADPALIAANELALDVQPLWNGGR